MSSMSTLSIGINAGQIRLGLAAANNPPVAVDDTATTDEETLVNIDVLANDTDADVGDTLSVTAASALNGTVTIEGDNTLNYTPDVGFTGDDTITYTVSDGTDTDEGQVIVTVNAVATTYTQNRVQTDGLQYYDGTSASGKVGNSLEFSAWFNLDDLSAERQFFDFGLDTYIRITTAGAIDVRVENTSGVLLWDYTGPAGEISAGKWYHLYVSYVSSTGTPSIYLNGVDVYDPTGNNDGPTSNAQDIEANKLFDIFNQLFEATPKFEGKVGDLWVDALTTPHGLSSFIDTDGSPVNLSSLAQPIFHLGGSMVAADWNTGTQNGEASLTVQGAGAFTDTDAWYGPAEILSVTGHTAGTNGTDITYTNAPLGNAQDGRAIFVVCPFFDGSSVNSVPDSVTVGGNAATLLSQAHQTGTDACGVSIWVYRDDGALGTQADIVVEHADQRTSRSIVVVEAQIGNGDVVASVGESDSTGSIADSTLATETAQALLYASITQNGSQSAPPAPFTDGTYDFDEGSNEWVHIGWDNAPSGSDETVTIPTSSGLRTAYTAIAIR